MGSFSIWHWLIVLLVVVLIFGTKKLKNIGTDLGGAVKGFKDGMKDGTATPADAPTPPQQVDAPPQQPVDAEHGRRRGQDQVVTRPHARRDACRACAMIDFGFDKIALIGAVALIVIGPEKLPRVARTVGTLLGKAQRYVADVKAEVNRSIELEELKKMKTQFEDAARDVEQTVTSEVSADHGSELEQHWQPPTLPIRPPPAAARRAPDAAAAVPAPEEELAPEARRHAAVVQAARRACAPRRSRARRAWRASGRRALGGDADERPEPTRTTSSPAPSSRSSRTWSSCATG